MSNHALTEDSLPEALVDDRRRVSLVWLIPLVAVLAALWLGYRTYTQQGPLVSITFLTAQGLEAGKTRVRFKDVDVGVVEAIELTRDLSKVRVRVRLSAQVENFLNDATRFWVVRPRLSRGQVSGLETLVGGSYIGVDLSTEGGARREFLGLETPPIVTATEPGKTFTLHADTLGSLAEGSPVQYRGIEVGRVVGYALREQDGVDIQVFVHAPHDAKVRTDTRFWNASGVGLSLDANGIRLNTDSLAAILLGGIAFGTPPVRRRVIRRPMVPIFACLPTKRSRWNAVSPNARPGSWRSPARSGACCRGLRWSSAVSGSARCLTSGCV